MTLALARHLAAVPLSSPEVSFWEMTSSLQIDPLLRTLDTCATDTESVLIGGCPGTSG
jgi:hypothetical protein